MDMEFAIEAAKIFKKKNKLVLNTNIKSEMFVL